MQSLLGHIPYNNVYISYLSYLSHHLSCCRCICPLCLCSTNACAADPRPPHVMPQRAAARGGLRHTTTSRVPAVALPPTAPPRPHCGLSCCSALLAVVSFVAAVCRIATVAVPPIAPPSCLLPIVLPWRCGCRHVTVMQMWVGSGCTENLKCRKKKKGDLPSQLQVMLQRKAARCVNIMLLPIMLWLHGPPLPRPPLLLWALGSCCCCRHMFPATAAGVTIVSPLPLVPAHGGG